MMMVTVGQWYKRILLYNINIYKYKFKNREEFLQHKQEWSKNLLIAHVLARKFYQWKVIHIIPGFHMILKSKLTKKLKGV